MKQSICIQAPAKINLVLDIVGKREDGYHLLRMLMQTVSLWDEVAVSLGEKMSLNCTDPNIPTDRRNIAWKAAEAFFQKTGVEGSVEIHICKRIPSQAGLAGGSTDGAAVLAALNQLYQFPLSPEELCAVGAEVGADIPFCLVGGTALVEGIGEKITPVSPLKDVFFVIAKPEQGISTAESFQRFDRQAPAQPLDLEKAVRAVTAGDFKQLGQQMSNVLEKVAQCKEVDRLHRRFLELGALGSCMTGSGSAVVGLFAERRQAERCSDLLSLETGKGEVFLTKPETEGCLQKAAHSLHR